MKINRETVLVGQKVVLVPYREEHVPTYHGWMQDAEIQTLTASEPLTLEEEYDMQRAWATDEDKLTFIILARQPDVAIGDVGNLVKESRMVGDVNIFFNPNHDSSDDDEANATDMDGVSKTKDAAEVYDAECEIMIAEPEFRGRGLAREALKMLMNYVTSSPTPIFSSTQAKPASSPPTKLPIPASWLTCKISLTNEPSIGLFRSLGFEKARVSEVWQEVEMRFQIEDQRTGGAENVWPDAIEAVLRWPAEAA
ncbi:hypothetical protein BCV70DRAFT_234704 [Testicularia cyperi]|uniref:N-acetyltransferase domain-containing protein n=1 Tax=Testicularia cyperi TaxID=1882483 RepID=A0A317XXB8_9BASI|nr:hypothetical protein BCV70DRAFT_234704 [Testicularia cyperi]